MSFRLSKAADEDLVHILMEGEAQFGMAQAERYIGGLFTLFETLADIPNMARLRTEITPPVHGHPFKSHIVFFDILEGGDIEIIRIRHAREDWINDQGAGA